MASRVLKPISAGEFTRMMEFVKPLSGWSDVLAVANSGGPDSTCLLFLLNRYVTDHNKNETKSVPRRLVSLTVDHKLQESSASMAERAGEFAKALGVDHYTLKLDWGEKQPTTSGRNEEAARDLRQNEFLRKMKEVDANALAFAHHLDDQVETMLMRLGRNSTDLGLGGMRPCRRWGMGSAKLTSSNERFNLMNYRIDAMKRWMVRPLLRVEKDRILETCEQNKLEYVNDPTNFQPSYTIRNAIRHVIKEGGISTTSVEDPSLQRYPPFIRKHLTEINVAAENRGLKFNLGSSRDVLWTASKDMNSALLDTDAAVDKIIEDYRLPSAPGTFMISPLSLDKINSRIVKEALIYRITRFVSSDPWGDPTSELGRKKNPMQRIINHLSTWQEFKNRGNNTLVAGSDSSNVWWRLIAIRANQLRTTVRDSHPRELAWLASRMVGHRLDSNKSLPHPVKFNITQLVQEKLTSYLEGTGPRDFEILYDNRFLLHFDLSKIPDDIHRALRTGGDLFVKPRGVWVFPQVVLNKKKDKVIHKDMERGEFFWNKEWGTKPYVSIKAPWIATTLFRPLTAI